MRLGYNTNGFAHHRLEDALVILAELGYQSIALTLDYHTLNPFDPDMPRQLAAVKALLQKHQLHSVIETGARFLLDPRRKHQPTLVSSKRDANRRLDFLKSAIDIAQELGSEAVSFWSGTPLEITEAPLLRKSIVAGCKQLCRYAEARQVRLAFEPEPGMYVDTMKRYAWLHQRVDHPSFGLTLDVGHLHCLGELPIREHLLRWRDCLWNVHIEDMRRGVHDHLMFGEGEMDFTEVLGGLEEIGYEGGVHVELSRHSHDAVNTAWKSMAFLRERGWTASVAKER
jgi:L-ribulose-5-phosphate 3-epimerase